MSWIQASGFQDFTLAERHSQRWTRLLSTIKSLSAKIITEVSIILVSKFGGTEKDLRSALQGYLAEAKRIPIKGDLTGVCRDPKDDMPFECAVRARASLIVSGDKDVLDVGEHKEIRVLTARQYVSG